ncbi:Pam17-domain-containing protein [Zopfia rhizophila CBS 207.26]|uniref:Presequence translocated-associated motor subunit PAM17 n=1 Tax=Zopfia rhizophila CBS 207.26 TaxID=1314779 RepID=A0A6A6DZC1_9PEZI|nr:Pam17-domain-containing protein [Zopfia rhizophila CBS 207.26]
MLLTNTIRPTRVFTLRSPAAYIAPCCAAASFTTTTRPTKIQQTTQHPAPIVKKPSVKFPIRHASTAPSTSATSSSTTAGSTATSTNPPTQLTWNRFLALRKTRRKISVAASSMSALATTVTGLRVFIEGNYDSIWAANFGLDPLAVTVLSSVGLMAVGWLVGPFFGNAVFNAYYRRIRGEIESKERQFFTRIKRHRVDPSNSSMANPVPDYYGEKIGSVADYRRWLKDQRAFNLKRGAYAGSK